MKYQWHEVRARAAQFSEDWKFATRESADKHSFWNALFDVFGVDRKQAGIYERRVETIDRSKRGFIDLLIPGVLLVEHKSAGLLAGADKQAYDYADLLPESEKPRYILTCDFQHWHLRDLETGQDWRFALPELKKHIEAFGFVTGV
ncbi:MAG: class I SAM-dependent DNA methyltransferase, partial [Proteobacteria bacterium]|nr:class I SAM-dependent DNA methyltransferase [Pseudomonadota bacterium]